VKVRRFRLVIKITPRLKYFIKCNGPYLNCPTKCNRSTKGIINVEVGYKLSWYSWGRSEKNINQTKRMTTEDLLRKVFVYIFSLPKIIDEEEKAYIIREKLVYQHYTGQFF